MEAALHEMLEARAIEQLMIRYIDRVDANDPAEAAACFADDGEWFFSRREVVGVGTMVPGDAERDRPHPGHRGRLPVETEP